MRKINAPGWLLHIRKNTWMYKKKYITFLHRGIRYCLMWLLYWWGSFHWGWNGQRQRRWGIRDVWLGGLRVNGVFSKRMPVELNIHYLQNRAIIGLMNSSSVSQKAPNLLRTRYSKRCDKWFLIILQRQFPSQELKDFIPEYNLFWFK